VTNYGALAILAVLPEKALASDLRLLIALETVSVNQQGERSIGMRLLADIAGVPYRTARRSRDRLVSAGLISCAQGNGRGQFSTWRILFPLKVSTQGGHLSEPERCPPEPVKVSTEAAKGVHPNSVTSGNANTALKAFGLEASGLSLTLADLLAEAVPAAAEREIEYAVTTIETRHALGEVGSARAYLRKIIENGDAASLIDEARAEIGRDSRNGFHPEWCGKCDERTRQLELDDGTPAYCPECSGRGRHERQATP